MAAIKFKVAFKKVGMSAVGPLKKAAAGDAVDFSLQEGNGDTVTVNGVNSTGESLDISSVATLAVTSDNPAVLAVDAPAGMTYKEKGLTAGTANVVVVATWKDNSKGPFSFTYTVTCAADPANPTGIKITHGPVTPN